MQKPDLSFQVAKLKTEAALRAQSDVTYSIVRPTAFFKSLSGQVEIVRGGGPFVYFDLGGGRSATCNPISEADLAMAIVDCVADPARSSAGGEPIWNVGGPDAGVSMKRQGEVIADAIAAEETTAVDCEYYYQQEGPPDDDLEPLGPVAAQSIMELVSRGKLGPKGMETLVKHVIDGYNAMPARGLCADCSDQEIADAVAYMVDAL